MTLVFLFPGQSSRYPEMLERLVAARAENAALVEQASSILGRDLAAHYRADNPAIFEHNRDVQIGVFLASHLHLQTLEALGVRARWSLGLSLGEYNHLVHIGALTFADALRLVDARGQAYDAGPQGAMASVFPLEAEVLEEVVTRAAPPGTLAIGVYNSPQQQVLSGERASLDAALALLDREHYVQTTIIEQRVPMHSPVFAPVARALRPVLERAPWRRPSLAYLPNTTAEILEAPAPGAIIERLCEHVHRPVRWRASIERIAARVPDPVFVEVGPRAVLYNLFTRKWRPGARFGTDSDEALPVHLQALAEELRAR